jgi:HEAT repeat protein
MLWLNKLTMKIGGVPARIKAIQQMAESNDPRAVEMIAKESEEDDSPEVQAVAAECLGKLKDCRALKTLGLMLKLGKPEVQVAAATAMKEIADPQAIPSLVDGLRELNQGVRAAVMGALVQFGVASAPPLVGLLKDPNRVIRNAAINTLAQLGEVAVPSLVAALDDKTPEIREGAAEVLHKMGTPAVTPMIKALMHAKENGRRAVAEVLGKLKEPTAAPALVDLLEDPSAAVRTAAANSLAAIGWKPNSPEEIVQQAIAIGDFSKAVEAGAAGVPLLMGVLKSASGREWEGVAHALADIGTPAAEPLLDLVKTGEAAPKSRALHVLGMIGGDSAVAAMTAVIQDPDPSVRESAVTALWNIGGPKAVEGLIVALKDEDRLIVTRATRALGELGDASAVSPLAALINAEDDGIRAEAVLALARIAPAKAVLPLARLAKSPATAEEAITALVQVLANSAGEVASEDLKGLVVELSGSKSGFMKTTDPSAVTNAANDELRRRGEAV